jgi:hypothetical protein
MPRRCERVRPEAALPPSRRLRRLMTQVRHHASDAALHAVLIGTIEPDVFADAAERLAKAAIRIALAAAGGSIALTACSA